MYRTNDPAMDFEMYSSEMEDELEKLPICGYCDNYIQDEYAYYIEGEWVCSECMNENYRREVLPEY